MSILAVKMRSILLTFILTFRVLNIVCCADDTVVTISNTNFSRQDTTVYMSSKQANNTCILVPALPNARETIAGLANSDKQLVKITVKLENGTYVTEDSRLKHWAIYTSLTGQSMLMLKESFDAMSLYTLGLGVESYSVTLNQEPRDCLDGKTFEEIEIILREHFLNNFGSSDHTLPSGAEICNKEIGVEEANRDRLVYVCCKHNPENQLQCSELTRSIWVQLLFTTIIIVQVLIILYSPIYMPGFMYKAKNIFKTYAYRTEPDKLLQLRVKIIENQSSRTGCINLVPKLQDFTHLKNFKTQLKFFTPDTVHTLMVKGIDLCVRDRKIVAEGNAPVTVINFVKDFFVRCKIRYDIASLYNCCMQNMWVKLPCKVVFRWYQCLSRMMMLISVFFLASPWLLRIWFYYLIEEEHIQHQKEICDKYNLKISYPGNLVTYLSPTHTLFLVIHILFAVEILLYIVLPRAVKERVKFTVRKCIQDMRDKPRLDAFGKVTWFMLYPLVSYGVIGCIVLPLWLIVLPLYCVAIALEVIPIANLSIRLLVNLIFYIATVINPNIFREGRGDQEEPGNFCPWIKKTFKTVIIIYENEANTRCNKVLNTLALIMSFVTVWLLLVLIVDCIAFYVECAVYALVGFILHSSSILKYVSFTLLVVVYGNECFSGVHGRYAVYNTGISSEVQGMVSDEIEEEASKSIDKRQNTAFRLPAKNNVSESLCLEVEYDRFLKWQISRLVLFLDKSDIPYIPTSFLFQMAKLNNFQCPGSVHLLYLKALLDFSLILLFLIFVFIVIFAFGQAKDFSSAGQAFAALATGFLPLILRKCLFQSQSYSTLDRSNLNWKIMFTNAVQNYSETWDFEDIILAETEEIDIGKALDTRRSSPTETADLIVVLDKGEFMRFEIPVD